MDKIYNITLSEFLKEYCCKYRIVESNRRGVGEHEVVDLGFSGGEYFYSSSSLFNATSFASSNGGVLSNAGGSAPAGNFSINQGSTSGQVNYHYGPVVTESLNSLSEKAVRSMEDLERILISLDPIKGKCVYLLGHFLYEGAISNFTKALTFASEIVELEEVSVCEIINTLLKDGYKGNFALLVKSARKLAEVDE